MTFADDDSETHSILRLFIIQLAGCFPHFLDDSLLCTMSTSLQSWPHLLSPIRATGLRTLADSYGFHNRSSNRRIPGYGGEWQQGAAAKHT